jgi:hypothetical protein
MSWLRGAHHATTWRYLLNLKAYQALDHAREIFIKPDFENGLQHFTE